MTCVIEAISDLLSRDDNLEAVESSGDVLGLLGEMGAISFLTLIADLKLPSGSHAIINLYKAWIAVGSDDLPAKAIVWFNLSVEYDAFGDQRNKISALQNALRLDRSCHHAAVNLGLVQESHGQVSAALTTWNKALQTDDARTALLNNMGRAHEDCKDLQQATVEYTKSLLTNPHQPAVLHHLIGIRQKTCEWPLYPDNLPGVSVDDFEKATRAMTLLAATDDIEAQFRGNASWVAEKMPPVVKDNDRAKSPSSGARIRIGYLSSDFCMHPIAFLMAELIETHDRAKFEIHGFCSTKDDGSDVRQRITAAFDVFYVIKSLNDEAAAELIQRSGIDILIDLNGLTLGTRLQIFRWRPAPIQITYLGYNGPIPMEEIDYIIADDYVIPLADAHRYRPAPLYMPGSFQVNDSKLEIAKDISRDEMGLPTDKFVFCCFSNTYKITETIFNAWIDILEQCPQAVFWLYVDNAQALTNLKMVARRRSVSDRLIFANRTEPSIYLGRLALADLFLDTFPYNAGTTASDALRVGLPLISLSGTSFISRMAGSLLRTMGLHDCVVTSLDEYIALATRLANNPDDYCALRKRVTPSRWHSTLGDTKAFARNLETKLTELHRQQL